MQYQISPGDGASFVSMFSGLKTINHSLLLHLLLQYFSRVEKRFLKCDLFKFGGENNQKRIKPVSDTLFRCNEVYTSMFKVQSVNC